jgi:hypothetical protein
LAHLDAAADVLLSRNACAGIPGTRAYSTDTVTPGTPLAVAVEAVLARAPSAARRNGLRSEIGRFLEYCEAADLDPVNLGLADLRRYRRSLGDQLSVNQLMTAANALVRACATVRVR